MKKITPIIAVFLMLAAVLCGCRQNNVVPTASPNVPIVSESPAIPSPDMTPDTESPMVSPDVKPDKSPDAAKTT